MKQEKAGIGVGLRTGRDGLSGWKVSELEGRRNVSP